MKSEQTRKEKKTVVILDVHLDNFYAFHNFHMNLTYPKKIVGSTIPDEHLAGRPNFRYKKLNIIMGANATGKSTFGRMLMKIFNFMSRMSYDFLTSVICDTSKDATFVLDMASSQNILYRLACKITPSKGGVYAPENVELEIRSESIRPKDSYESCVQRMIVAPYISKNNFVEELEKIDPLDWMFEYPKDINRTLHLPNEDKTFCAVLENLLRALDPAIIKVEMSKDVKNAYVVRFSDRSIILQTEIRLQPKYCPAVQRPE